MKVTKTKEFFFEYKEQGKTYESISKKMNIHIDCIRSICRKRKTLHQKKRGRKFSLSKRDKLAIKRQINLLKTNKEKVNSSKIKINLNLSASRHTICRHIKELGLKYAKIKKMLPLKKSDKDERLSLSKKWLTDNHPW